MSYEATKPTFSCFFMAALRSRCGYYIFALWFLSYFFFFFFFLQTGCLSCFYTWCGLSANLERRSEMCCTRLAGNTGRKNCHLRTIAQICRAISSQLRHVSTIGEKLLNNNIFSRCPHNMANFVPLTAEIGSGV